MTFDYPHRRFNALTREWVLVSPHRANRPWLGQVEKTPPEHLPSYDPTCYLCPGNERTSGVQNPVYQNTFVFENDFSPLLSQLPEEVSQPSSSLNDLFKAEAESGICRVVCFSPRHDLTLPELSQEDVGEVVKTWRDQTADLGQREAIHYVQVFENKGAMMGCSNPHPHSQVWASSYLPNEPAKELCSQTDYYREKGSCLLCDYLQAEIENGERIVAVNDTFAALVPFWAVWPFEVMVTARRHTGTLLDLNESEISDLADILRQMTTKYDNLFEISFPYSMGFHQSPTDGKPYPEWHLHMHFYPPLLRSATVRKFMVGYEMLAMPQRDLTPETAAQRLRDLSSIHYKRR